VTTKPKHSSAMKLLDSVQSCLNFEGAVNPQFAERKGLGKVGVAGFALGTFLGVHLCLIGCQLYLHGFRTNLLVSTIC
jgi:hypothetical protein